MSPDPSGGLLFSDWSVLFLFVIRGLGYTVYTDHQALVSMRSGKAMNRRVHGWALKLQDFSFRIIYRRGVANANADGLSRQALVEDAEDRHQTCMYI